MQTIGVLITCHNRKEKTIACLRRLYAQDGLDSKFLLKTYLVDDGCTDGTGDAVRYLFPQVQILQGDGNLYWCGGMRMAFERAMHDNSDFYLWLNDDVELNARAVDILLNTYKAVAQSSPLQIIVGSTFDSDTGNHTYGGFVRYSRWNPFRCKPIIPHNFPIACDTFNGNCVLIHHSIKQIVGNLDKSFTHAIGDNDYGFRAIKIGCSIWVAPSHVGVCNRNSYRWDNPILSFKLRFENLFKVKGYSIKEMKIYTHRHGGILWPIFWIIPVIRGLFFPKRISL